MYLFYVRSRAASNYGSCRVFCTRLVRVSRWSTKPTAVESSDASLDLNISSACLLCSPR